MEVALPANAGNDGTERLRGRYRDLPFSRCGNSTYAGSNFINWLILRSAMQLKSHYKLMQGMMGQNGYVGDTEICPSADVALLFMQETT